MDEVLDEIIPAENGEANAPQGSGTDGEAPKKKKRKIKWIIAGALVLYAAVALFRQYVFIPGKYEAPPTPVPTVEAEEVQVTPEAAPYINKVPVKMYFTQR